MADDPNIIELTADVVASYVSRNNVAPSDLPVLIKTIHAALSGQTEATAEAPSVMAATRAEIRRSVTADGIRSFEDGRVYKSLKRHLATKGLTPAEYRAKWGLPEEYKMVSEAYSARRSELAKALGLGRRAAIAAPAPVALAKPPPAAAAAKKPSAARKPRVAKGS